MPKKVTVWAPWAVVKTAKSFESSRAKCFGALCGFSSCQAAPRRAAVSGAVFRQITTKRGQKGSLERNYHSLYGVLSNGEVRGEFECTSTIPVVV